MTVQPHLRVDEGDVHDVALLPGDPGRVERIAAACDTATDLAHNREYRLVDAEYEGVPLTICSTGVGSPSAAIALEELAAAGVETVIRPGTIGASARERSAHSSRTSRSVTWSLRRPPPRRRERPSATSGPSTLPSPTSR
jgi:purine-nucleoside phosphorylase